MKYKRFATAALAMIVGWNLCGVPRDVFLQSSFGWRKNVEKENASGTLQLSTNNGMKLSSPDYLLVRAVSINVPVEKCAEDEKFFFVY